MELAADPPRRGPSHDDVPVGDDPYLLALVATLDEAVVVRDRDGRVVLTNALAETLMAVDSGELEGPEGFEEFDARWDQVRDDGSPLPHDEHPAILALRTGERAGPAIIGARRVDGTRGWFSVTASPLRSVGSDQLRGVITTFRDVTERRQGREIDRAILEMARRLATTPLDGLGPVVERHLAELTRITGAEQGTLLTVDLSVGELVLEVQWPTGGPQLTGTPRSIPLDVASWLLVRLSRHDVVTVLDTAVLPEDASLIRGVFDDWGIGAFIAVPVMLGGRLHRCLLLSWPEPVAAINERVFAFVGLGAELLAGLAEREQAEVERRRSDVDGRALRDQSEALAKVNDELLRASQLKDEFLATMSHELRTPLAAVLGLAEMLEDGGYGTLTAKQLGAVGTIQSSGQHLLDLINDLLDLSQIEARMTRVDLEPVEVAALCEETLDLVRARAARKGVDVAFADDSGLDRFLADDRRLKQILLNLLDNALKFTESGGSIGLEVSRPDPDHLGFTVWDTGIGIEPAVQSRLFEPFVQADQGSSRRYEGTGLGLALVARLTELLEGRVEVESGPGSGSRFTVILPVGERQAPSP